MFRPALLLTLFMSSTLTARATAQRPDTLRLEVGAKQVDRRVYKPHLLDKSPYMVYGEVPQADGSVVRMTEIEVPLPKR